MTKQLGMLALVLLSCFGCGKSGDYVPSIAVNFQMSLNDPRLAALKNPGGAVIINGYGVAGLILYRTTRGYAAYDRCSAYQPPNKCALNLDNPTLTVTDPCSGAKWLLQDGTPAKAPAVKSLKAYNVNVSYFEIFVTN